MEVGMSLNQLVRLPLSSKLGRAHEKSLIRHSVFPTKTTTIQKPYQQRKNRLMVVEAKGRCRRIMPGRSKPEDDGNPKLVIFIRMANDVDRWYPLDITAKDNVLGKYIYKDTPPRNLAKDIYKYEKKLQKMAVKQFSELQSATEFRYGYKIVENNNLGAAQAANDVIELHELKTVVDKVKGLLRQAKESFGKMTFLNSETESSE